MFHFTPGGIIFFIFFFLSLFLPYMMFLTCWIDYFPPLLTPVPRQYLNVNAGGDTSGATNTSVLYISWSEFLPHCDRSWTDSVRRSGDTERGGEKKNLRQTPPTHPLIEFELLHCNERVRPLPSRCFHSHSCVAPNGVCPHPLKKIFYYQSSLLYS